MCGTREGVSYDFIRRRISSSASFPPSASFFTMPVFMRCLVHLVIILLLLDLLILVFRAFPLCMFPPLTFPPSHPEVLLEAKENEQDLEQEDDPAAGIEHHPFWVLPTKMSGWLSRALPHVAGLLIEADISLTKGTLITTTLLRKVGLIRLTPYSNSQSRAGLTGSGRSWSRRP